VAGGTAPAVPCRGVGYDLRVNESADRTGDPGRLLTLSDGVFAIAITLLVLGISVRQGLDPAAYRKALHDAVPELLAYGLSFLVIAGLWRDHRQFFQYVGRIDEVLVRLTLVGLGLIALMPFPTTLLAEYGSRPQSVAIYSGAVVAVDGVQLAMLLYLLCRPALSHPAMPAGDARAQVIDLGATIAVFVVTIPIAFASPSAAKWFWLVLVPLKMWVARARRRWAPA
jgi:uncharacterized membrane protein